MNKLLFALLLTALPILPASLSVTFTVSNSAAADLELWRFTQRTPVTTTLSSSIVAGDTTLTLASTGLAVGTAVFIDSEPILITASGGGSYTVTRASSAGATSTAASHASGSIVYILQYPSMTAWIKSIVQTAASQNIQAFNGSTTLATALANLQAAQSAYNAALLALVQ